MDLGLSKRLSRPNQGSGLRRSLSTLKKEAQTKLNVSVSAALHDLAKLGIGYVCGGTSGFQLRMVEDVEHLRPELQVVLFLEFIVFDQ